MAKVERTFEEYHQCSPRKRKVEKPKKYKCLAVKDELVTERECKYCDCVECPWQGGWSD